MKSLPFRPHLRKRPHLLVLAATVLAWFYGGISLADEISLPDDHAPIGVMGDHNHKAGEWMLSYRYGFMEMDGNRDGTDDLSSAEVLADFMVAPVDMTTQMHMFGLMYGVTDRLTVMSMGSYVRKSMNHVTRMGKEFEGQNPFESRRKCPHGGYGQTWGHSRGKKPEVSLPYATRLRHLRSGFSAHMGKKVLRLVNRSSIRLRTAFWGKQQGLQTG